ncbi:MAG: CHC2 zinc finger domain-containing protein [Armatimonadota bacterium]
MIAPPARYLARTYLRTACDLLEIAARRPRDGTFGQHAFSAWFDDSSATSGSSRRTIRRCGGWASRRTSQATWRTPPGAAGPLPAVPGGGGRPLHASGRVGARFEGCCPLHEETRPSFLCYPDGRFSCFGSLQWGDAVDPVSRMERVPMRDAVARLARGFVEEHRAPPGLRQGETAPLPRPVGAQAGPGRL